MEILLQVIGLLTKEEARYFKIYLTRIATPNERKDEKLFDMMRKSGAQFDDDAAAKKLYGKSDKNAYYRLKNRLQEDVCDALALLHTDKTDANYLYRQLMLFNIFQSRNNLKLSMYFLKRAEKKALTAENFELLDIVYANYIRLSNDFAEINPEEYIEKRKQNADKLNRLRAMDQTLAAVLYRLKTAQTFERKPSALMDMLETSIKQFSGDHSLRRSKTFQTRLYRAVSQQLLQTHNYQQLEKFMRKTIDAFQNENWFDKNNHDTKLQMLVYLINALFRNEKYSESLEYAEQLGEEIKAFNKLHFDKYVFYFFNSLYINYARTDIDKAIRALDDLDKVMKQLKNSYYEQFILLNKSTLLFERQKYNDAIRQLVRLYLNDSYRNASETFKLKVAVAELIMQYESGDLSVFKNRLGQVRKQFTSVLKKQENSRDKTFLNILEKMMEKEWKVNKVLAKSIKAFIAPAKALEGEESELLNYRQWLSGKVNA